MIDTWLKLKWTFKEILMGNVNKRDVYNKYNNNLLANLMAHYDCTM